MDKKYRRRLKTADDLRRFLADAINKYEAGKIDDQRLRTLCYAVNILQAVCKDASLEQRVQALEDAANGQS